MNFLIIMGCIGGIVYFLRVLFRPVIVIRKAFLKYRKYKDAYEELELRNEEEKEKLIGFKPNTKEEEKVKIPVETMKWEDFVKKSKEQYKDELMKFESSDYYDLDLDYFTDFDEVDLEYHRDYDDVDLSNN